MVCARVLGNDTTIGFAATQGNFELNVFKPVIAHAFLQSVRLLADACASFDQHCARGIEADEPRIAELVGQSLMLVTALSPHIGYDAASRIARHAHKNRSTLRASALELGLVSGEDFDRWVDLRRMVEPG